MKRYRLYIIAGWLMAWVMTLAGCHADALSEDASDNGTGEAMSSESYINLRIVNTNTTRTTEAATSAENAIYDGILAFFVGNGETAAQLRSAVVIDQLINNPGTTASVDVVQRMPTGTHPYPTTSKIYVLALLNTTSAGFTVANDMLYLNGASLANKTRAEIQSMIISSVGSTDKHVGLFMSNKPKDSGSVLLPLYDPSWVITEQCYLYDSREAITASTAPKKKLTINVERAAAKVKVTNGIGSNSLTSINLDGNSSRHPKVHTMTWAVNNYNTESYAIRGGTGHSFTPVALTASGHSGVSDFRVYQQRSHQSGDAVYIAENTTATETEVIVEVRLKDESNVLMHDCFVFRPFNDTFVENAYTNIYTSAEQYIAYLRDELPAANKAAFGLSSKNNSDLFKYATVKLDSDGSVDITLANSDFTTAEQEGLSNLATFLSNHTTGYQEGKMYYTYKIKTETSSEVWENKVLRNNVYNLTLLNSSITAIGRPTP